MVRITEKDKMRITVAKDMIKQINTKRFIVKRRNGYVKLLTRIKGFLPKVIASQILYGVPHTKSALALSDKSFKTISKGIKKCEVCAKGAFFMSTVDKYNKVKIAELVEESLLVDNHQLDDPSSAIGWLWDAPQLDAMERVFENYTDGNTSSELEAEDALIAIAQNIVDNNGRFDEQQFTNRD